MRKPKILILTEGENEVKWIGRLFEDLLAILMPALKVEIIKDRKKETIIIENLEDEITIYIKTAVNQNIKDFNEFISGEDNELESIEKLYELKEEMTEVYSLYDYDPGSTTTEQCHDYFALKEKQDNFYPIMSYPGYEAQEIQGFHYGLYNNYEEIKSDKGLHNIDELLSYINVTDTEIRAEKTADVATRMKMLLKQLIRSSYLRENISRDKYHRNLDYIYRIYGEPDYFHYLEEQVEIHNHAVTDEYIRVSSFLFCILESIVAWIEDEDEE